MSNVQPAYIPASRRDAAWLRTLSAHRDLLFTLVQREIKIRYKQSIMGFLWAILMPVIIVGAGILVRFVMARLSGSAFSLDEIAIVTAKAVPWAFFTSAIRLGSMSLISNSNLVTKIYMPREIFPFAAVLSQLFDFVVAAVAMGLALILIGLPMRVEFLYLPLLLLLLILQTAGAALLLSAGSLFFRDVKYIVEVFVTFAIFFTPVFYEASMFGEWGPLLLLNPVAPILESIGAIVVGQPLPAFGWLVYSSCFGVLGFMVALASFKRMEPYFAESV